jgi:hypothetical protein
MRRLDGAYVFGGRLAAAKTHQLTAPVVFYNNVSGGFIHVIVLYVHLQASFGDKVNVFTHFTLRQ